MDLRYSADLGACVSIFCAFVESSCARAATICGKHFIRFDACMRDAKFALID